MFFVLRLRQPPESNLTDTPLPYTTLCRSTRQIGAALGKGGADQLRIRGQEVARRHHVEELSRGKLDRALVRRQDSADPGGGAVPPLLGEQERLDRKSTRLNSSH